MQLQAENSVQAEALAKLSERLQGASQQVDDTQQMLAALQCESSSSFCKTARSSWLRILRSFLAWSHNTYLATPRAV